MFVFIIVKIINTVQYTYGCLILRGSNFCGFLSMVIYEVVYIYDVEDIIMIICNKPQNIKCT